MVSVQNADLSAVFRVPDVNSAIGGARDDKLTVGGERSFQGDSFGVHVTGKRLEVRAGKGINQSDHASIGRNEDGFSIWAELEPSPLDVLFYGI